MIFILLPVHNRRATSEAFAGMLARQTLADFRLLLIDDGSTDGTAEAVLKILPERTHVLRGTGDWWWGGALHQGWLWLKDRNLRDDDVVLICNDDVDLPREFLARGADLLARHPNSLFVAKSRNEADGTLEQTGLSIDFAHCRVATAESDQAVVCAPTRGLFIRWTDMRRVGGFHPHLIPHYLSDLEWTLRANRRGIAIRSDVSLWLTPHLEKTGFHEISSLPLGARLRRLFSTKYAVNPLHWSAFVILGFPARYWLPALARVALWTAGAVFKR